MQLAFKKQSGFTVTELLVVSIILVLMVSFAIPNYKKTKNKAHEKDISAQLRMLHEANKLYYAREEAYFPDSEDQAALGYTDGNDLDMATINNGLNINLTSNETAFVYSSANDDAYSASMTYDNFTIQVTQAHNSLCCATAGMCPSVPDC